MSNLWRRPLSRDLEKTRELNGYNNGKELIDYFREEVHGPPT